jgi:uncharacterized protein YxjI
MRYLVKQKVFSLSDSYTIKDEDNIDRFSVKSEIFTLGRKLRLYDNQGEELVYIQQQLFKLLPTYNIYLGDNYAASVRKELTFFKAKITIEAARDVYSIEGDIFSHEFLLLKNERKVGQVSKEWFAFSDSYGVEINDKENQSFILALIIVLDEILYSNNN